MLRLWILKKDFGNVFKLFEKRIHKNSTQKSTHRSTQNSTLSVEILQKILEVAKISIQKG